MNWISKTIIGALLALSIFLGAQWFYLHLKGIEGNPWQTIFRTRVVKVLEPLPPHRDEKRVTLPCVPIQVIEKSSSSNATGRLNSGVGNAIRSIEPNSVPLESLTKRPTAPAPDQSALQDSNQDRYLVNRYRLKEALFAGTQLSFYLNPDGSTDLLVDYLAPKLELGKLREIGLWIGPEYTLQEGIPGQTFEAGVVGDLSYQQDLFRVGPAWSRLRLETGYSTLTGLHAKAQIGIPVFRF